MADLVERIRRHSPTEHDQWGEPIGPAVSRSEARAIIEEVADWIGEQRTEEEMDETWAAKSYVSSWLRAQALEE